MKPILTRSLLFMLALAILTLAAPPAKIASKAQVQKKTSEKVLMFFMNPNGAPCQRQLSILDGIADSLVPLARVSHIKTTNDEDISLFRQYGIRGLPSLIITDTTGKETHRFAPGIQSAETILRELKK